jgi:hypothetical protein
VPDEPAREIGLGAPGGVERASVRGETLLILRDVAADPGFPVRDLAPSGGEVAAALSSGTGSTGPALPSIGPVPISWIELKNAYNP